MKYIVVILSVVVFTAGLPRKSRVWGGQSATSGQFPFIVAVDDVIQFCGGVIIAPNWILTAAQCLFYLTSEAAVYVGSNNNQANGTAYRINHIIAHEGYDESTLQNDIGLIKLNTDLVFGDTVQAIEFSEAVAPNTTCTVVGWGDTQDQSFPDELSYADVTTIDEALCQNISADALLDGEYLGPGQLCTLSTEGKGACYGDNGGPLVCDGKLAGIVSYTVGNSCGTQMPDVHTSITAYLNWILAKIQP